MILPPSPPCRDTIDKTQALVKRTSLAKATQQDALDNSPGFSLFYLNNQLTLRDNSSRRPVDVCVDFCTGKNRHRQMFGGGAGQPLARAVNVKALRNSVENNHVICDATGGFGRDALVFASLGCRVVLLEQSVVVFELLSDGLTRAQNDEVMAETAHRMQVHLADSTKLPLVWPHKSAPHTIYLDPMYPDSGKNAAAKKEMQTLKKLFHSEADQQACDSALLTAALKTASDRVVVKRPKSALPIAGAQPVGNIASTNTRYDIYRPAQVPAQ